MIYLTDRYLKRNDQTIWHSKTYCLNTDLDNKLSDSEKTIYVSNVKVKYNPETNSILFSNGFYNSFKDKVNLQLQLDKIDIDSMHLSPFISIIFGKHTDANILLNKTDKY